MLRFFNVGAIAAAIAIDRYRVRVIAGDFHIEA